MMVWMLFICPSIIRLVYEVFLRISSSFWFVLIRGKVFVLFSLYVYLPFFILSSVNILFSSLFSNHMDIMITIMFQFYFCRDRIMLQHTSIPCVCGLLLSEILWRWFSENLSSYCLPLYICMLFAFIGNDKNVSIWSSVATHVWEIVPALRVKEKTNYKKLILFCLCIVLDLMLFKIYIFL